MDRSEDAFRAPKGTRDLLPPESAGYRRVMSLAVDEIFARAGYKPVETPIFEHTEVFERGVGEASEVVTKQMYTFVDSGDRSLTLRPEGTAPVVRAVLEHSLDRAALPVKLCYASAMFRQERPQKGRYREFWQVGIEAIGSSSPNVDAEVIEVAVRYLRAAGVEPTTLLNSVGHLDASCRTGYIETLTAWLRAHADDLAPADRGRVDTNPLRTFDSKEKETIAALVDAPSITDHLCSDCREHFEQVRGLLDELGVAYEIEPRLVRGLDYYTRTAFEFVAGGLGSQNAVGGGGRYDGLSESLGGPALPGIGFALGVDRIIIAAGTNEGPTVPSVDVYVVALGEDASRMALSIATDLRKQGIGADLDLMGRGMKGQMKDAARSGARWAAIVGDDEIANREVTLKDLGSGEQRRLALSELAGAVNTR